MSETVKDMLFGLYEFGCTFLPFAVAAFLLFAVRSEKSRSGEGEAPAENGFHKYAHIVALGARLLFGAYVAAVFRVTGSGTLYDLLRCGFDTRSVNLLPFSDADFDPIGYVLNVVMCIPFGILVPFIWKGVRSFPRVIAAGALFSLLIEASQLLTFRSTDVDDVILNTLGAAIGYGIFRLCAVLARRLFRCPVLPDSAGIVGWTGSILLLFAGRFFLFNGIGAASILHGF